MGQTDESHGELVAGLQRMRDLSGLSLKALERQTHASDSALSRYLCGHAVPPWPVVEGLCQAAGRDPGELRPAWEAVSRPRASDRASPTPARSPQDGLFTATASWLSPARLRATRWLAVFALGLGAGVVAAWVFFGPAAPSAATSVGGPTRGFELTLYDTANDGLLIPVWTGGGVCPTDVYRVPQNLPPNAWNRATSYLLSRAECRITLFESSDGRLCGEKLIPDGAIHTLSECTYRRNSSVVAYQRAY